MEEKNNFGQQGWQAPQNQGAQNGSQFLGTGEGEVPLAKMPSEKIDIRTMASDMKSVEESGGGAPRPYSPQTQETKAPAKTETQAQVNFASQFEKSIESVQKINAQTPQGVQTPKEKKGGVGLFWTILVVIIVLGLIAIGYFFVYPKISGNVEKEQEVATTEKSGVGETEEIVAEQTQPTEPVEEIVPPAQQEEPIVVLTVDTHSSFFKTKADLVFDAKLSAFTLSDLKTPVSFEKTSVPLFKEIVWKTQDNKPLSFGQVASLIFPDFFTQEKISNFLDDFTLFSYSNTKGTWLGFVVKLKDNADLGKIQDGMSVLQKDPGLKNIFLSDPGVVGPWKDGKVRNKPTSLASFSLDGATISYTWFDRYLLISSNIDGAEEAGKRLGY